MLSEKRRKILFIPKWYPDRKQDQNGNFIQQHAYAASKYSDIIVLFANYDDFSGPNLIQFDFKKDSGIPTFYLYYKKHITGIAFIDKPLKLILYFACLMRGYRIAERLFGRPDLLHVHVLLRTGLFAWFKCLTDSLPYIITEHWTLYLPQNSHKISWLRKKLSAWAIKNAAAMNTVSENLKEAMLQLGFRNKHFVVIPNVVDTATFLLPEATVSNPKVRFLHVAVFNEAAKNLSGLLRTIHELSKTRSDFELRIVGFGPAEIQLKNQASELGLLNKYVFFEGKLETPEVAQIMQQSNVFVLFSNFENLPCVLIEALASGLPVISTNVGGIPEMIKPEHGILIEPKDEKALLKALQFMLDNHRSFNKTKLRQYAEEKFSYEAVGRQFAALYETVLNSGKNLPDVR